MALASGTRLGSYEIVAAVGAGGMGEVYRARDSNLKRTVAIKVLPDQVAADAGRLARFQREAEILASLNHPNIAQIFGLEKADGITALVMELVEGPTLADRIAHGPIAVEESLPIARQIAEALEAAHEEGIIHLDLKPANIKLRPDGTVKVLDFGLAKSLRGSQPGAANSEAVTLQSPVQTESGIILGTAPYMSPEQARGRPLDKRADIWAFGCVLYEMLSGSRAFHGATTADTLSAVLRGKPDWDSLPVNVTSRLQTLLRRCLDIDPRRRLRDIGEARVELDNLIAGIQEPDRASALQPPVFRRVLIIGLTVGLSLGLATAFVVWVAARPDPPQPFRLSIVPPPDAPLRESGLAISPDGKRFVYVSGDGTQLSVWAIGELAPRHIPNLGSPAHPFISPDGQWIGFFDGLNALRKVPMTGGPAVTIAQLGGAAPRGGTWSPDGTIVFATDDPATGLWRVPASGGSATVLTKRERGDHYWPHVLPSGRAILFTQLSELSDPDRERNVVVLDLTTGTQKLLVPGSHPQYAPTGHLVYAAAGTLRAIRFDATRLEVTGTPVAVPDQIASPAAVSVSPAGILGYVTNDLGALSDQSRRLVWVDRRGKEEPLSAPPAAYAIPRISPDGTKVVIDERAEPGLSMWDLERQAMTRFTFGIDAYPVWSPDGQWVAFTSFDPKSGTGDLYRQAADGSGGPIRLAEGKRSRYATSFAPDGSRLLFREEAGAGGLDIGVLTLKPTGRSELLIQTEFSELNPEISPDGRFLAYESNRSGRTEIYVCPFPEVSAGLWQISTGGGVQPAWSGTGRELYYRARDGSLMSVAIELEARFKAGAPAKILEGLYFVAGPFRSYDPSRDGRRFLMIRYEGNAVRGTMPSLVLVLNWFAELERFVPTD